MNDLSSRKLTPEILDSIPHDDPGALRSRRDLRRINRFMGSESWILKSIPPDAASITEIGAGDGHLLSRIATSYPGIPVAAYDLAPRPDGLPEHVLWHRGDVFDQSPPIHGGILIANLFLHHFTDKQLAVLGNWVRGFDTLLFNEPIRSKFPLIMGKLAAPFIHAITRHDMRVSIEAGFRPGELPAALGLESPSYRLLETASHRGSIRMIAQKITK